MNFLCVLVLVIALSVGINGRENVIETSYTDCGSKFTIKEVQVTGCTAEPCILHKGKTYEVKITAVGAYETSSLKYEVKAKKSFISRKLLEGNACDQLVKGSCPIQAEQEFTFANKITVAEGLPSVSANVKAQFKDDKGKIAICVDLQVEINSPGKDEL